MVWRSSSISPPARSHDLGQFYFLVDPTAFAGDAFWERLEIVADAVADQPNARLPGSRREFPDRVSIDAALWSKVNRLAARVP